MDMHLGVSFSPIASLCADLDYADLYGRAVASSPYQPASLGVCPAIAAAPRDPPQARVPSVVVRAEPHGGGRGRRRWPRPGSRVDGPVDQHRRTGHQPARERRRPRHATRPPEPARWPVTGRPRAPSDSAIAIPPLRAVVRASLSTPTTGWLLRRPLAVAGRPSRVPCHRRATRPSRAPFPRRIIHPGTAAKDPSGDATCS